MLLHRSSNVLLLRSTSISAFLYFKMQSSIIHVRIDGRASGLYFAEQSIRLMFASTAGPAGLSSPQVCGRAGYPAPRDRLAETAQPVRWPQRPLRWLGVLRAAPP